MSKHQSRLINTNLSMQAYKIREAYIQFMQENPELRGKVRLNAGKPKEHIEPAATYKEANVYLLPGIVLIELLENEKPGT